jgi:hypothetical protein
LLGVICPFSCPSIWLRPHVYCSRATTEEGYGGTLALALTPQPTLPIKGCDEKWGELFNGIMAQIDRS